MGDGLRYNGMAKYNIFNYRIAPETMMIFYELDLIANNNFLCVGVY